MWDIPFIPEPLAKPTPWHTSCPAVLQAFWPKTSNHHKPWPWMRISIPILERRNNGVSQEKKKSFTIELLTRFHNKESSRSKIGRKQKKKRNSLLKIGRKQKKKKSSRSKIGRKKEKYTERSSDQTIFELSQANKKRKETTTWSGPLPLIANQNPVLQWLFCPALNKNRKGKGQNTQSQISHKKNHSWKCPIDPWSRM